MYEDILNDINNVIEYKEGDQISPLNNSYFPKPISKDNFHVISTQESSINNAKLCFIDGGSAELLRAPNFSLFFIRVYANISLENKTINDKKVEFYCLAKTKIKDEKIFYDVCLFNLSSTDNNQFLPDKIDLELFSFDKTIVMGENRAEISKLGDIARRFAEIKLATGIIPELDTGDIIVLDGNLRATYTNENKYLDALYKKANEKQVIISALCKTSNLLTEKGNNMITVLNHLSPQGLWYYYPIMEINEPKHNAEIMFVKLNLSSEYIFRFEICKQQFNINNLNPLLDLFVKNSNDYSFPGYPYGLIKADELARISNQEKHYLKSKILFNLKHQDQKNINSCLKALDAHDVLDGK